MIVGDLVIVVHQLRGRLRLRLHGKSQPATLAALEAALTGAVGVRQVRVNLAATSIVVEYEPARQSAEELLHLPIQACGRTDGDLIRARIDESIVLRTSPDSIWRLLGDPSRAPLHLPAALAIVNAAPGSWRVTFELVGQRLEGEVQLREQIPSERLVLTLTGAVRGRCVLTLAPDDGGTRVREEVSYDLSDPLLNWTLGRIGEPAIRRLVRQHLASLPSLLAQAGEQPTERGAGH